MTLLQDNLPSSENFFRFQANYEKIAQEGGNTAIKKNAASPTTSPRRIASPKFLKQLSPLTQYLSIQDEVKNRMFTVNTEIQKHLLKYAASKENLDRMAS